MSLKTSGFDVQSTTMAFYVVYLYILKLTIGRHRGLSRLLISAGEGRGGEGGTFLGRQISLMF